MAEKYLILYKRDTQYEANDRKREFSQYSGRMLFDKAKGVSGLERAIEFAEENMPAIIMKRLPLSAEDLARAKSEKPYLVVGEFYGKFKHYDYGGGSDWLTNYDVVRCSAEEVESVMEKMAGEEHFVKAYRGLELKVV